MILDQGSYSHIYSEATGHLLKELLRLNIDYMPEGMVEEANEKGYI